MVVLLSVERLLRNGRCLLCFRMLVFKMSSLISSTVLKCFHFYRQNHFIDSKTQSLVSLRQFVQTCFQYFHHSGVKRSYLICSTWCKSVRSLPTMGSGNFSNCGGRVCLLTLFDQDSVHLGKRGGFENFHAVFWSGSRSRLVLKQNRPGKKKSPDPSSCSIRALRPETDANQRGTKEEPILKDWSAPDVGVERFFFRDSLVSASKYFQTFSFCVRFWWFPRRPFILCSPQCVGLKVHPLRCGWTVCKRTETRGLKGTARWLQYRVNWCFLVAQTKCFFPRQERHSGPSRGTWTPPKSC